MWNIQSLDYAPEKESTRDRLNQTDASSLSITSTISKPNMSKILKAISIILLDQIEQDEAVLRRALENKEWSIFNEDEYLREKSNVLDQKLLEKFTKKPTVEDIENFMLRLYDSAAYSPECNILSLLYINRLKAFTGMPIHYKNWRPILLISLVLSNKIIDDDNLSNIDFAFMYPFFTLDEINKMEIQFLKLLHYEITVRPSTYAKYYFELRSFFKAEDVGLVPMNNIMAQRLERNSNTYSHKMKLLDKSLTVI